MNSSLLCLEAVGVQVLHEDTAELGWEADRVGLKKHWSNKQSSAALA